MSAQARHAFDQLLHEAFLYSAWDPSPGHEREIRRLRAQVVAQLEQRADLLDAFETACAEGEQARSLANRLARQFERDGDPEATRAWLARIQSEVGPRIARHLDIRLKKLAGAHAGAAQRTPGEGPARTSGIEPLRLSRGQHHPNSLRHLAPSHHWQVLIDETGVAFDEHADTLPSSDCTLGRLVALAIPAGTALPPMAGFHGSTASAAEVDKVVTTLLGRPVGIFGFTVHDPAAHAASWIGHVITLVRWTLAQLPVEAGKPVQVDVLIEQSRGYDPRYRLRALTETLAGEFRRISPQRYAGLVLQMHFMDKSQPRNGYVDAIAFTWGSPAAASRDRLKKTAWLGHCLLRPSDQALERLYLALHRGRELSAPQWYALCAAAAETTDGVLHDALARLGERLSQQPGSGRRCLDEVRRRMQAKAFGLHELELALAWLERWGSRDLPLPPAQQLMLESARLATDNHRGKVETARIERCLELAHALHDESPAEACEAILRIAVATTNVFEFEAMRASVLEWLAKPVAIPGLLNHAKLQSTLGQIDAFSGRSAAAIEHFDRAIAAFARLSDPAQAKREIAQTTTYRLLAMMDATPPAASLPAALCAHFAAVIGKSAPVDISRSLAHSGQDGRFAHHLWLRALASDRATFADARAAYLEQPGAWQTGDDHPWPLIDAYRAWLLRDAGQREAAAELLAAAIRQCVHAGSGPTLRWMGAVLRALAAALKIDVGKDRTADPADALRRSLPAAPHEALARFRQQAHGGECTAEDIHAALRRCLPFSFH